MPKKSEGGKPVGKGTTGSPPQDINRITREGLKDGSLLKAARALTGQKFPLATDEELLASFQKVISKIPKQQDIWVFGYGSLIWNPSFKFTARKVAVLQNWHRSFCLSTFGRGASDNPGVILGLDKGGSCKGVVFRIDARQIEEELKILWQREMIVGAYKPCWLPLEVDGEDTKALAFVVNQEHGRYLGDISEEEVAKRIVNAHGPLGSCLEYFENTFSSLSSLGLHDEHLEGVRSKVDELLQG
ncbi:gamma-glutamylcyclotransferase [Flexibacterium corallicola]|uniref:gamma-glutamylcyclotransferase n=1 Tax=Flexibacterium corallicola TaxID=3037259 RepID=UPI00286EBBA7|nr:gamma-glutamylcyclotransferase [Pseudovibrio sp. M1P-2-3]